MSAREDGARRAHTCPARSPESGARCALPDNWRAHARAGSDHETEPTGDGARQAWPVTPDELCEWTAEPDALVCLVIALAERHAEHTRAATGCPKCIADERVETARDVARAFRLPFDEVPVRLALAGDDLRPRFNNGGLLAPGLVTGGPSGTGPVIFGSPPAGGNAALLNEAALYAARMRRERGQ